MVVQKDGADYLPATPPTYQKRKDSLHGSGAKEEKRSSPEAAGTPLILPLQTVSDNKKKPGSEAAGVQAKKAKRSTTEATGSPS